MKYNKFGQTGIELSVIGLGSSRYNKNWKSIAENADLLLYAHDKGINHFDCCPGYTSSEEVVSIAIKQLPKNSFYTTTKDQVVFFKSKMAFKDKIYNSLENIGVDYFDFFYIWNLKNIEEYQICLKHNGQYESLLELKQEGLIKHILLSSHLTGDESSQIIKDRKIEGILLNMNIMNFPYTIKASISAKQNGMGVGTMSPLAGGLIPMHNEKFSFLSKENTPAYEALKFITNLPSVDFCYLSVKDKNEIDFACNIANIDKPLKDNEIAEYQKLIGEGLTSACTGCSYCDNICSKDIPVSAYMQFYNYKQLFDMPEDEMQSRIVFAKKWFMLARKKGFAKDCIGCGDCEKKCPQKLDIVNRMNYLGKLEKN